MTVITNVFDAITRGDVAALDRLLSEDPAIADQEETRANGWRGAKPLHVACGADVHDDVAAWMVQRLLNTGALPNVASKGEKPETPLTIAVRANRAQAVEALLRAGANPSMSSSGWTSADPSVWPVHKTSGGAGLKPAHLAVKFHHAALLQRLLDAGVSIEDRASDGRTLLHQAVHVWKFVNAHTPAQRDALWDVLMRNGADVNALNDQENFASPLTIAAYLGLDVVVERLISAGANVHHGKIYTVKGRPSAGWTALHEAARQRFDRAPRVAQLLIDAGADVHARAGVGSREAGDPGRTVEELAHYHEAWGLVAFLERRTLLEQAPSLEAVEPQRRRL